MSNEQMRKDVWAELIPLNNSILTSLLSDRSVLPEMRGRQTELMSMLQNHQFKRAEAE